MHAHIPIHDLWWLAAGGAGYGARYVTLRLRASVPNGIPDPTADLLRLQALHGYNPHALVSIAPGARAWRMAGVDAAIIFSRFGHVWLAPGDPLADETDFAPLLRGFMEAARKDHCVAAFVPATERLALEATQLGMTAVKIGAAPYFDLKTWQPRGDSGKKIRAGINQARRAGVCVEVIKDVSEELKRETAELCLAWLKTRRATAAFGWLLALDPFLRSERKKLFAARNAEGLLVGLLAASPIPVRDGWYLEDVLRSPKSPPGTADLLVFSALQRLKDEGAGLATLGTAPLAQDGHDDIATHDHPAIERALQAAAKRFSAFYNFAGVRRFKAKFAPSWWESEYVLLQHGVLVPTRVAHALLRAIVPGGLKQVVARKAIKSLRSRAKR